MSSFWRKALPLAGTGLGLTLAASYINFTLSKATVDGYMRDWVAANGYGGSTDMTLGILLTNLTVYPLIQATLLVLVLPLILANHLEWTLSARKTAAMIGLPSLLIAALWWAGPSLVLIYTLPATALMAAACGLLVLFAQRLERMIG